MNNKAIITTTGASTLLHKDSRLVYLTPGVITPKLARQPPRWKSAKTSSIPEIQASHVTTTTQGVFCLTSHGPKYP